MALEAQVKSTHVLPWYFGDIHETTQESKDKLYLAEI